MAPSESNAVLPFKEGDHAVPVRVEGSESATETGRRPDKTSNDTPSRNPVSLIRSTVSLLVDLLEADLGAMVESSSDGRQLEMTFITPSDTDRSGGTTAPSLVDIDRTMAGIAWSSQSSVVCADVTSDQRFSDSTLRRMGIVAGMLVPIKVAPPSRRLIGVFRRRGQGFTAEEVNLVESLASPLAYRIGGGRQSGENVAPQNWSAVVPEVADPEMRLATGPAIQSTLSRIQAERRISPRHDYQRRQWIGPIGCGVLPRREEYFPVECVDISTGGFAFLIDRPPTFNSLVVILDMQQPPIYVAARIVHVRKRSQNSRPIFEIGCQFVVRL